MKKRYDSLLAGSARAGYCLKLTQLLRKGNSSSGLMYFFPVFAISLLAFTSPNSLFTRNLSTKTPLEASNAALQLSEVCAEQMLTVDNQTVQIEMPKFDPALGKLLGVELILDCKVMVDIEKKKVSGTDFQLLQMIDMSFELPTMVQKKVMIKGTYRKSPIRENERINGFKDVFEKTTQINEVLNGDLTGFVGTGNQFIALSSEGLVNFQDDESVIASKLSVKACLKYTFE